MGKYKELVIINIKQLETIRAKSLLAHQYTKNIYESGAIVETEIRSVFSKLLPKRIRVTHGYIAKGVSLDKEPIISPQIDMIFVDQMVPN